MEELKAYLAVIFIQATWAGLFLLSKAALNGGLNPFVFTFYRQAIASLVLLPVTLIVERERILQLSIKILAKIFLLALVGITFTLNLYGPAVNYTSANLVATTANLIPILTFIWAVLFRMEVVNLRSPVGKAKLFGVLASVVGVMILALYKGPPLTFLKNFHLLNHKNNPIAAHTNKYWPLGTFLIILCNSTWSLWIVLQGRFLKSYSSKLLLTTLQCIFSAIQSFVVAVIFQKNFHEWKLGLDVRLLTVVYCGVIIAGLTYYIQTWCIEKKGPVFTAMFCPLSLILTAVISTFMFGELINLGSVISALLMIMGLYSVLCAKRKEELNTKFIAEAEKEGKGYKEDALTKA